MKEKDIEVFQIRLLWKKKETDKIGMSWWITCLDARLSQMESKNDRGGRGWEVGDNKYCRVQQKFEKDQNGGRNANVERLVLSGMRWAYMFFLKLLHLEPV